MDAQLRYFFKINPDLLTDEEWAMRVEELKWIRAKEAEASKSY
uniref:Uncharacterized protein n=1 Tax=virus sp. ctOZh10 TaxID=2828250 RepID=A0A8S5RAZ1_9VIRU|nr:MAG TPA: hypothetical protein [virus sp. ctOZh10]DAX94446.1 MAG TPA: hypothetical protein [Caudoviricetes sp.]DAX96964.1 MAG TPA: hypothetical protein [Caudoviricetes sp.]